MEAVEMTITALADLGLPMKLKPSAGEVAINLLKAKIKLRNKSTEDLLALPKMTDKEAIAKMQDHVRQAMPLHIGQVSIIFMRFLYSNQYSSPSSMAMLLNLLWPIVCME